MAREKNHKYISRLKQVNTSAKTSKKKLAIEFLNGYAQVSTNLPTSNIGYLRVLDSLLPKQGAVAVKRKAYIEKITSQQRSLKSGKGPKVQKDEIDMKNLPKFSDVQELPPQVAALRKVAAAFEYLDTKLIPKNMGPAERQFLENFAKLGKEEQHTLLSNLKDVAYKFVS